MKLTNNTSGPKAIPTTDQGVVILQAGETADLNVPENDAKAIKRTGMLDKDGTIPSIADLQRDIASAPIGHLTVDNSGDQTGSKAAKGSGEDKAE